MKTTRYFDAVRTVSAIVAAVALAGPAIAWAQCEISQAVELNATTPASIELRNAIFKKLCTDSGGELVDGDDKAIRERLVWPSEVRRIEFETSRPMRSGKAVLTLIIHANGTVAWIHVLESSGNGEFDSIAKKAYTGARLGPVTLDGKPVHVFRTMEFAWGKRR